MTGTKKFLAVAAVIVLAGLARADGIRQSSTKYGFSVVLPGVAKSEEKSYDTPAGTLKQYNMMHADNGRVYIVSANELPPALLVLATDTDMEMCRTSFVDGFVKGINGTLTSSKSYSDGAFSGTEVIVNGAGVTLHGRVFLSGGKLYAMFTTETAEATEFYKSFQIEKGVALGK